MHRNWALIIVTLATTTALAADSGYRLPPQDVVDLLTAPVDPLVSFSPDGRWMLIIDRQPMPGIEDLARRRLPLAGIRVDPAANGQFRPDYGRGLTLRQLDDKQGVKLPLPDGAKVGLVSWSHKSQWLVYTLVTDSGTQLWAVAVNQPTKPRRLTDRLSTVLASTEWMPSGEQLLCRLTPENRGAEPLAPKVPTGPNIQESSGNVSPVRTYQDLLATPYDEELFEHYATSQLATIDMAGKVVPIGKPGLIDEVEPSPDGQHLLVVTIKRPFSYTLPYESFPKQIAVWNLQGQREYLVADVPMAENIPIEGVRIGPRGVTWAASEPARLYWFEALDGGDPRTKAAHRDRLMTIPASFGEQPSEVVKVEHRALGTWFFENPSLVAVREYDRDRRWLRILLNQVQDKNAKPNVLVDRSVNDAYGNPGDLVLKRNAQGHPAAQQNDGWVYFAGLGATPQGNLPFFDRRDPLSDKTERLWRCEPGQLESVAAFVNCQPGQKPRVVTRQESPTAPQNYLFRDLETGAQRALTEFTDPTPQIRGIRKELVKYTRADGVPLSATLYLPADYKEGTRLPLFIWAYPLEYSDASTAGQVTTSPWLFTRLRGTSHLALLTQGYAVLDNATMPIVGDPETMNDTFVEQIVNSAKAAIDKAVELGVADRDRVAVGGHSYGAFMTANLLAHCDLFKAGIARSGAYNRTLTPFGFQSERRPLWQAKNIYMNLSPLMHADKIKTPLLLIHGENDDNAGTFPVQSQRLFQAVKGNGGTVRLVMLPHESHGYAAQESVLHVQAETIDWLNKYVRDAQSPPASR